MGFISKYNASATNTDLTVNVKNNSCVIMSYRTSTSWGVVSQTGSNIYYINGPISNQDVTIKFPNTYRQYGNKVGIYYKILGSGAGLYVGDAPFPSKIWEKDGYIYVQFNGLNITAAQTFAVLYQDHVQSGSTSYYYYYGVDFTAVISPKWTDNKNKIYDNGTSKIIKPSVFKNTFFFDSGSPLYITGNGHSDSRWWQVTPGNTYTIRCIANSTAESALQGIRGLNTINFEYPWTKTNITYTTTTDAQTGEKLYTFTVPSGCPLVGICYSQNAAATTIISIETVNPRLEGQRTAGWYNIDDYEMASNAWLSTGY